MKNETLSWEQYEHGMKRKKAEWSYQLMKAMIPELTQEAYDAVWAQLATPGAYFSSLPINSWNGRNTEEQLILECSVYYWDWTKSSSIDCTRETRLQTKWDPDYYRCYVIRVPDESKQASLLCVVYSTILLYACLCQPPIREAGI